MKHVLIVEDHPMIQNLYKEIFRKAGYAVKAVTTSKDALALTKGHQFDIILLDMLLPDGNGLTFLRSFHCPDHPQTRVVVTSNVDTPDLHDEALRLGAVGYFIKAAITPKQLLKKIEEPTFSATN